MIDTVKKEQCSGCGACENACPAGAIYMERDAEGFYYPRLVENQCISCQKCIKACPAVSLKSQDNELLYAVACHATDRDIRERSTSGGIFSVIAEFMIEKLNGIVYGVAFDDEFHTVYSRADKREELKPFCGSKYVQCQTETIYRDVKEQLDEGKTVLFSGLPCHAQALNCFLGKDYPNLYVLDMVCFGIGSPHIWQEYLENFHNKKQIEEIVFKDKTDGWKQWRVKFSENGKEKLYERKENLYMNSYLQRVNIRKACFRCPFKGLQRKCDFTVADCWGEGEKNQRLNDDRGLSALLVHTKKGKDIFEQIRDKLKYEEYDADILMRGNRAAYAPVEEPENRERFFRELKEKPFWETFLKYFGKADGEQM